MSDLKQWLTAYVNHKAFMEGNTTTGKKMVVSNIKVKDQLITDLTGGFIDHVKFKNCSFAGKFEHVIFRDCIFINCKFGAVFNQCDIVKCHIGKMCSLKKSTFNFCNLSYTEIYDDILANIDVDNCFNVMSITKLVIDRIQSLSDEISKLEKVKMSLKGEDLNDRKENSEARGNLVAKKESCVPTNTEGSE